MAVRALSLIKKVTVQLIRFVVSWLGVPVLASAVLMVLMVLMFMMIINMSGTTMSAYTSTDADIETTGNIYTHITKSRQKKLAKGLENIFKL